MNSATIQLPAGHRLQWTRAGVVALMFAPGAMSYFDRTIISIAGPSMMVEFGITPTRMGTVYSSFLFSYPLLMIPAGTLAGRFGPRKVLAWMAFGSALFHALVAIAGKPGLGSWIGMIGIFPTLLIVRWCAGAFMSPMYPASGRVNANWAPAHLHSRVQAFVNSGAGVAARLERLKEYRVVREVRGVGLVRNTVERFPELGTALARSALENGVILHVDRSWFVSPAWIAGEAEVEESAA